MSEIPAVLTREQVDQLAYLLEEIEDLLYEVNPLHLGYRQRRQAILTFLAALQQEGENRVSVAGTPRSSPSRTWLPSRSSPTGPPGRSD